jgi:hypothetical protein
MQVLVAWSGAVRTRSDPATYRWPIHSVHCPDVFVGAAHRLAVPGLRVMAAMTFAGSMRPTLSSQGTSTSTPAVAVSKRDVEADAQPAKVQSMRRKDRRAGEKDRQVLEPATFDCIRVDRAGSQALRRFAANACERGSVTRIDASEAREALRRAAQPGFDDFAGVESVENRSNVETQCPRRSCACKSTRHPAGRSTWSGADSICP